MKRFVLLYTANNYSSGPPRYAKEIDAETQEQALVLAKQFLQRAFFELRDSAPYPLEYFKEVQLFEITNKLLDPKTWKTWLEEAHEKKQEATRQKTEASERTTYEALKKKFDNP